METQMLNEYRWRLWEWFCKSQEPGTKLPWHLIALRLLIFPRESLLSVLSAEFRECGFDIYSGCWVIHGNRYSDQFFRALETATPSGQCFTISIEEYADGQRGPIINTHYHQAQ